MAKILSIKELQDTMWPEWLQEAFGENLISAFLHGDCLMEGFDPFKEFWQISFLLKDNSPDKLLSIQELAPRADNDKIRLGYYFTPNFLESGADVFPLEFLHIAHKNVPLLGETPLVHFTPNSAALRAQCEREWRGALLHLHTLFVYRTRKRTALDFFLEAERRLLPILYGIHFLETGTYPENREIILNKYPFLKILPPGEKESSVSARAESYIVEVQKILNQIDSMEI